jgi:hypothetical protein
MPCRCQMPGRIGARESFERCTTKDIEIVGVVEDARQLNVKDAAVPAPFFSLAQQPVPIRFLEVRSSGDPRGNFPFAATASR